MLKTIINKKEQCNLCGVGSSADENKCDHCDKGIKTEDHTCPYAEDIHGDSESLCNCCDECTQQYAWDI